jgi:hypothetical protein
MNNEIRAGTEDMTSGRGVVELYDTLALEYGTRIGLAMMPGKSRPTRTTLEFGSFGGSQVLGAVYR